MFCLFTVSQIKKLQHVHTETQRRVWRRNQECEWERQRPKDIHVLTRTGLVLISSRLHVMRTSRMWSWLTTLDSPDISSTFTFLHAGHLAWCHCVHLPWLAECVCSCCTEWSLAVQESLLRLLRVMVYVQLGELELLKLYCIVATFYCEGIFFLSLLLDTVECRVWQSDNCLLIQYVMWSTSCNWSTQMEDFVG